MGNTINNTVSGRSQGRRPSVNILAYAARQQAAFTDTLRKNFGYSTFTTFWSDLTIAERFGESAVKDTYKRVKAEWADDYKYFTEFILCLNHKIWQHSESNEPLARLYDTLWREADGIAATWKGEAAEYYFKVTD